MIINSFIETDINQKKKKKKEVFKLVHPEFIGVWKLGYQNSNFANRILNLKIVAIQLLTGVN